MMELKLPPESTISDSLGIIIAQGSSQLSATTNGYVTLPGGILMQWGTAPLVSTDGTVNVTFPIKFPTAVLNITTSHLSSTASSASTSTCNVKTGYTTSGFTLIQDTQNAYGIAEMWLAIGY